MDGPLPLPAACEAASAPAPAPTAHGLRPRIKNAVQAFLDHRLSWRDLAGPVRFLRNHWAVVGLVLCLGWAAWLVYPSYSVESPIVRDLPGFFHGSYVASLDQEPLPYDLYFPPQFREEKGPFPLIVFLAGYGERDGNLKIGLAPFIRKQVKERGRFDFVVFFPTKVGLQIKELTIEMLDHLIAKHHIDPNRIYLTGHSSGGVQVWMLASGYGDRWAAIAPLCAPTHPDIDKVRHIPCWIFQGGADTNPPPENARTLVEELRKAGAEVHYTEYPGEGHLIWPKAYGTAELYSWFAAKRRP